MTEYSGMPVLYGIAIFIYTLVVLYLFTTTGAPVKKWKRVVAAAGIVLWPITLPAALTIGFFVSIWDILTEIWTEWAK